MQCLGSGSKGQNINQKLKKKNFTLQTHILTVEKREIIKISRSLNGSSSVSIKISEKEEE